MTRDDAQEMWDTILQQELIYRDRDNMVVQRLACRLYPAPELDRACLMLETHEEDPQGAVREYMKTTGFAVPSPTPAEEAMLERKRLLAMGQLDMFIHGAPVQLPLKPG